MEYWWNTILSLLILILALFLEASWIKWIIVILALLVFLKGVMHSDYCKTSKAKPAPKRALAKKAVKRKSAPKKRPAKRKKRKR